MNPRGCPRARREEQNQKDSRLRSSSADDRETVDRDVPRNTADLARGRAPTPLVPAAARILPTI
jgi:hypothetical protein